MWKQENCFSGVFSYCSYAGVYQLIDPMCLLWGERCVRQCCCLVGFDAFVCLFVCLSTSILPDLHVQSAPNFLCMLTEAMTRSFSVAIRCVLLVLLMTSCLHIMVRNRWREKVCIRSDSTGGSTNLTLRRIPVLRLTHQASIRPEA